MVWEPQPHHILNFVYESGCLSFQAVRWWRVVTLKVIGHFLLSALATFFQCWLPSLLPYYQIFNNSSSVSFSLARLPVFSFREFIRVNLPQVTREYHYSLKDGYLQAYLPPSRLRTVASIGTSNGNPHASWCWPLNLASAGVNGGQCWSLASWISHNLLIIVSVLQNLRDSASVGNCQVYLCFVLDLHTNTGATFDTQCISIHFHHHGWGLVVRYATRCPTSNKWSACFQILMRHSACLSKLSW